MVRGQVKYSGRLDQAHGLIVEHRVLFTLELAQVIAVEHENAIDPAQGKGIRLAGDLDEQGTDDRHSDRQLEHKSRSLAGAAGNADRAAHRVHHALNHIKPDAAAGDLGDVLLGREPREEEKIEQLGLAEPGGHRGGGQPTLDDLGAQSLQVNAAAIIGKDDLEHPRSMARLQADGPDRGLAGCAAVVRRFETMVQCIADQMVERRLEPIEDVAVDAGGLTDDLKPRLLAELTSQVTNQAWEAAHAIGQWPHPAGQDFMMQPAGNVLADTGKLLNRLDRLTQTLQILGGLSLGLGQQFVLGRRELYNPWLDRRSSRSCNDSKSPVCLPFSRQRESTSGGSR